MELNNVGKRIAMLRKKNGLSQMELATKLNVSDKAVSKWENGGMPGIDLFPKLAEIFNVSIDYLMIGNNTTEPTQTAIDDVEPELIEGLSETETSEALIYEDPEFEADILELSIDELRLILADQRDLYTKKEIQFIEERLKSLCPDEEQAEDVANIGLTEREKRKLLIDGLPRDLVCPKCDGINPIPDQFCMYCDHDFLGLGPLIEEKERVVSSSNVGCIAYFIALLLPLVGIIYGITKKEKSLIIFSIIVYVISLIFSIVYFNALGSAFIFGNTPYIL